MNHHKKFYRDFPVGPMVKALLPLWGRRGGGSWAGELRFNPWWGNKDPTCHTVQQKVKNKNTIKNFPEITRYRRTGNIKITKWDSKKKLT